jgi:hypothetical protein
MAFNYTYATGGAPTAKEIEMWDREFRLFDYQAPDEKANSEARRRGWGFEEHLKPPPDCYEYVAANLKRHHNLSLDDRFRPEAKFSLRMTMTTIFAWLRTMEGTRWLLHLNGIELVPPHPGFAYFYQGLRLVEPEFGLRIYKVDRSARTAKSPDEYYGSGLIKRWHDMLAERRGPSNETPLQIGEPMWRWVAAFVRNWLREKEASSDWPRPKPERISGYVWARELLRPGSQTEHVWTVIGKAEVYKDESRIYRIQRPAYLERIVGGVVRRVPPDSPGVVWDGRKDVHIVPLNDVDKHEGASEQTIDRKYRCQSCGQIRCCTAMKGSTNERLCMSCRGTQLESGYRPSLKLCQYRECRRCPSHLRNEEDFINLVSRLNVSSDRVARS